MDRDQEPWTQAASEAYIHQQRLKQRERERQEISFSLILSTSLTAAGALIILIGFFMPARTGGWFALSLFFWIWGGVLAVLFGGFLLFALRDLRTWSKAGKP